ncbi:hypothetical protein WN51_07688 [Melipona quadrifasciata]|uniref:Uncharacterized protein n=1 Tax=Melipona quadrifasciata TaxID=166423 RepID=A0A0N1ITY6_9HYME|nr:hypothetical protein WN51_07688 [Melipona quadrifasciata]
MEFLSETEPNQGITFCEVTWYTLGGCTFVITSTVESIERVACVRLLLGEELRSNREKSFATSKVRTTCAESNTLRYTRQQDNDEFVFDRYKNNLDSDCFETSSIDSNDSDVVLPKHKTAGRLQFSHFSDSEEDKTHPLNTVAALRFLDYEFRTLGGCAPSVEVLPIFDVKQQSVRNPVRMGGPYTSLRTFAEFERAEMRVTRETMQITTQFPVVGAIMFSKIKGNACSISSTIEYQSRTTKIKCYILADPSNHEHSVNDGIQVEYKLKIYCTFRQFVELRISSENEYNKELRFLLRFLELPLSNKSNVLLKLKNVWKDRGTFIEVNFDILSN